MVELHNKYDLGLRDKTAATNQPKKVLIQNKGNEVVVLKPSTKIATVQTKQAETKETQTKTLENKEEEVHTKEP
jgi:transposase-like protein